jgi:hypothetical protein
MHNQHLGTVGIRIPDKSGFLNGHFWKSLGGHLKPDHLKFKHKYSHHPKTGASGYNEFDFCPVAE